jgi:hypothetical protein
VRSLPYATKVDEQAAVQAVCSTMTSSQSAAPEVNECRLQYEAGWGTTWDCGSLDFQQTGALRCYNCLCSYTCVMECPWCRARHDVTSRQPICGIMAIVSVYRLCDLWFRVSTHSTVHAANNSWHKNNRKLNRRSGLIPYWNEISAILATDDLSGAC